MITRKKGIQLGQAVGAVLALMLIALAVIIGIVILSSLSYSTRTFNTAGSGVNESVVVTTAGTPMAGSYQVDANCGTITTVYNSTNYSLNTGNYTQTGCNLANKTSAVIYGSLNWLVTYPYTYSKATAATNASDVSIVNFSAYPALVGLVGTIIFLGIVIGVLVASFVFGGKRGA